ncbi:hypothetical protein Dsin_024781 [Dipteronia sinensis]|uniref:DUF4283 domain-containing protein n=1 Tax=Dipteronia sinensis TaxID=43782 RepID=A0AAE0DWI9_9ROSI|nr:hypothetical protein Dsin_024781 [Dipteronia sinensis]
MRHCMFCMDSEDIASLCASLSISECDGHVQLLDGKIMAEAINRLSLCVVGKVLSRKIVNRDAFIRVIGKIWQIKQGMDIKPVTGNTFSFHFRDEHDLKVVSGSPWCFDNALIVLERPVSMGTIDSLVLNQADFWVQIHQVPLLCMTMEIGRFLGGMIGIVLEVYGGTSGDCVGKFLRIRVQVDITRPLKRYLQVDIFENKTETIMVLRYERLPNHCFRCEMVDHTTSECREKESGPIVNGKEVFPFGI